MSRNHQKKGSRTQEVDEESMKSAIDDVMQGRLSYRKAALKYHLKTSTLESRIKKLKDGANEDGPSRTFTSKFTSLQVFSSEEEEHLTDYIINFCKLHHGLIRVKIRKLAYEYARALNLKYPKEWDKNQMAGLEWLRKYKKRNSNLNLRKLKKTSAARSFGFNKTAVKALYSNLAQVFQRHNFTPDRIFNFDEFSVSPVLDAPKSQKPFGKILPVEKSEVITFGPIISANGKTIPPLLVFPRVLYKDHFLKGAPDGSIGAANRSGSINDNIFISVLKHIQSHTLSSKDDPILLLCDNHESHTTLQAVMYARDNGINIVSFPPHTSHRLQPLEVGVFGSFNTKLKTAFNNWYISNPGKKISICNIPKLVTHAYFESFTEKNIRSGFKKAGMWPLNKITFSSEDLAPIDVNASNDSGNVAPNTETNSITREQQLSICESLADMNKEDPLLSDVDTQEYPYSLLKSPQDIVTGTCKPSTLAAKTQLKQSTNVNLIPKVVSSHPKAVRNEKTNKERKPGKSHRYIDPPKENKLEGKQRQLKKIETEKKAKAVKRNSLESNSGRKKKKAKKIESDDDSNISEGSQISLRGSSTSSVDLEIHEDAYDCNTNTFDMTEKIKDDCYVLIIS